MNLLGAIVGGVAKLAGAAGQALGLRNQTQIAEAQSRALALAQKRDSDNRQLGLQRMEFDAKMEMVRQAARAKERDEDRQYSLSLKKVEVETLIKTEKMRQAFQALEAEKQRDFTQSIEKFKAEIQIALQGDSIAFQRWKTDTDREFTLALRELDALIVRQRDRQIRNAAQRDKTSPVHSVADDILKTVLNREQMPLTIFFSPPVLRYDPTHSASPQNQFPMMEYTLSGALAELFKRYSLAQRPIKFMGGDWITKNRRAESAVHQIYVDLQEIPVIVLESEVEESFLNINIGFWNNDFDDARFEPVVRKFRWRSAIAEISQRLLSQWQAEGRETIVTTPNGKQTHPEFIRRNREEFTHYMEVLHCIHVGMVADEYFLLYAPQRQLPLLPTLLPDLLKEVNLSEEDRTALICVVINYANALFDGLAKVEPATIVELRLAWAKILQSLPNRYAFADQVQYVMQAWLQQRNVIKSENPLTDIINLLIPEDKSFVDILNPYLAALELSLLNIEVACYQRGLRHLQANEYQLAKLDFDRTISLNDRNDEYYFQRGFSFLKLEEYASAIKDFDKASKLQPQRADIYEYWGDVFLGLKNYETALEKYNQAVALNSITAKVKRDKLQQIDVEYERKEDLVKQYIKIGEELCEEKRYEEAIVQFEEAIRLKPESAFAHESLGSALYYLDKVDEAISVLRLAIDLDPENKEKVYSSLAVLLDSLGDTDESISILRDAISKNPEDGSAHFNLGLILSNQDYIDEAIIEFTKSIELNTEVDTSFDKLLDLLALNKDFEQLAIKSREAIAFEPLCADYFRYLAQALILLHNYEEAIENAQEAERMFKIAIEEYGQEFQEDLENEIATSQKSKRPLILFLAEKFHQLHDSSESDLKEEIFHYEEAVRLGIEVPQVYFYLALAYGSQALIEQKQDKGIRILPLKGIPLLKQCQILCKEQERLDDQWYSLSNGLLQPTYFNTVASNSIESITELRSIIDDVLDLDPEDIAAKFFKIIIDLKFLIDKTEFSTFLDFIESIKSILKHEDSEIHNLYENIATLKGLMQLTHLLSLLTGEWTFDEVEIDKYIELIISVKPPFIYSFDFNLDSIKSIDSLLRRKGYHELANDLSEVLIATLNKEKD